MSRRELVRIGCVLAALAMGTLGCWAAEAPPDLPRPDGKPADMSKPVSVFILLGQSNMVGMGKKASLEAAVKEKKKYPYLVDDAGAWTVRKDVRNVRVMCSGSGPWKTYQNEWMTISGNTIGPEIGIGHYLGNFLDAPVMILKSCIGNRALSWDLLPPGAEGYAGNPDLPRKPKDVKEWYAGVQYDGDVRAALDVLADLNTYYPEAKKHEVAGFFFWQGEKDCGNADWANRYEQNLVQFIKALRKDFECPDAKFVLGTLGEATKGMGGNGGKVLDAQLAVDGSSGKYSEFKGNVATVYANPLSMGGSGNGHYGGNAETYMNVGEAMGQAMVELLKTDARSAGSKGAKTRTPALAAPQARQARKLAPGKAEELNGLLLKELLDLSAADRLKPVLLPLSLTRASVSLVSVQEDNTLTFRSDTGKTVAIPSANLKPVDFANLAVLVTQLKPDSRDAFALAGAYLESLGRVDVADKKFAEAGPEAAERMKAFFEPQGP